MASSPSSDTLRKSLRSAGLSEQAIEAAWPTWWSDEAEGSSSARAELRFAVARKLGISPTALSDEKVEFVWYDTARFKHLSGEGIAQQAALASFGVAVGRLLIQGANHIPHVQPPAASDLRRAILKGSAFVDLASLLGACWSLGIPVIHLRVFPLATKSMHAMVVKANGRFAILMGRDAQYPAPIAFSLAHEIGHASLGHIQDASALIEVEDPIAADVRDEEEESADRFALSLLTGSAEPEIKASIDNFSARALADAVLGAGPEHGIEPGTLALCVAYRTKNWPSAMAALRHVYTDTKPAWSEVNRIASSQLDWDALSEDSAEFLRIIMGLPNG